MALTSVAVYCGSSVGSNPAYSEQAAALGALLAQRSITLIYGGGNIGLMGKCADAALSAGGKVIGVIPEFLMAEEIGHLDVTELKIVSSMHARKAQMEQLADAFIAMPGGFGTLEELCEILTWGQLGLHSKPVGLLNTAGFYDHFLKFLDHAVAEKFLKPKHHARVLHDATPAALLDRLTAWQSPVHAPKVARVS